nr:Hok/Gef family protein [Ewingella americana]
MLQKLFLISLIVFCITLIAFTGLTRNSLCEIRIKQGETEVAATLAYESKR